jgi:hypothetical protein
MSIASISAAAPTPPAQPLQKPAQAGAVAQAQASPTQQTGKAHHHRHGGGAPPQSANAAQPATSASSGSTAVNLLV